MSAKISALKVIEMSTSNSEYHTVQDIQDINKGLQWVPESLQLFLHCLIPNKLKQVSLGQCVTQAARSKSILSPIPFGLGVQLDKTFGSKWLVNHLSKLGLSITSD